MSINSSFIRESIKNKFYKSRYKKFFSFADFNDEKYFLDSSNRFYDLASLVLLKKQTDFDLNFIIKRLGLNEKSNIIFFLNGYYYKSINISKKITFKNFSKFDDNIISYIRSFYSLDKSNVFVNDIYYNEGCFINFPSDFILKEPIFVINLFDKVFSKSMVHLNNIYVLDSGVNINLMEFYYNESLDLLFNIKSLIYMNDNSSLNYSFFNNLNSSIESFLYFSSIQKSNTILTTEFHNFFSNYFFSNLYFNIIGNYSRLYMNMSKISKFNFSEDIKVYIKHFVSNSYSNIKFKGLVKDSSKLSFMGIIDVSKFAYKTDSYLKCDGLLLSNDASIDLYPELDIKNNDVKCVHGATVGNISKFLLYYIASRGIDKNESLSLLIKAFLVPVISTESPFFDIINKFLLEEI